jgi:hypothetical protein
MATISITVRDSLLAKEVEAVAAMNGWTATIPDPANPEQTIPNITKEVFFKRQIKAWARNQAVEYANRTAMAAVVMEADN